MSHIVDNPRFRAFRDKLAEAGITLVGWATLDGPKAFGFNIVGSHPDAPKTAIAMNYDRDGFGWFPESRTVRTIEDVQALTAPKTPAALNGDERATAQRARAQTSAPLRPRARQWDLAGDGGPSTTAWREGELRRLKRALAGAGLAS